MQQRLWETIRAVLTRDSTSSRGLTQTWGYEEI
jgi:hypothetical protein